MEDPVRKDIGKEQANGAVKPRNTAEVFDLDSGGLANVLGGGQVGDVHNDALKDTVRLEDQTTNDMPSDFNGIITPALVATVNPSLSNIYKLQFKVIQEVLGAMRHNDSMTKEAKVMSKEDKEQAIVPKATEDT